MTHIWYYSVDLSLMSKSKHTPVIWRRHLRFREIQRGGPWWCSGYHSWLEYRETWVRFPLGAYSPIFLIKFPIHSLIYYWTTYIDIVWLVVELDVCLICLLYCNVAGLLGGWFIYLRSRLLMINSFLVYIFITNRVTTKLLIGGH